MDIVTDRVLDRLAAEDLCIGAVFTTYSFDPAFFEEHVLRAVLRLTSDPVEQSTRFHSEARQALQTTPVAVFADAGERQPGRRLPYDLLEVSQAVFHPKSALLLYGKHARLMIGSGNLTFAGYGGNSELFVTLDLRYDDRDDVSLLRAYDGHLERIARLPRQRGMQLSLLRDELARRLGDSDNRRDPSQIGLLDSTVSAIIDQVTAHLPGDAVVERIGLLAPFYERDDAGSVDDTSVLGAFLSRQSSTAVLDIGVAWDNPQLEADGPPVSLEKALHHLCAWAYEDNGEPIVEYLVPTAIGPSTLAYIDHRGATRRWPVKDAHKAAERRELWILPTPAAFAPHQTIKAARESFHDVRLWLYPKTRLVSSQRVCRPLHAKLLLVAYRSKGKEETLIVLGSANMSRRALLLAAGRQAGNVELGIVFRVAGFHTLPDLVPALTHAPLSALDLQDREFPALDRNHALAIDQVTHDPAARTLRITWSEEAKDLPPWRLTYGGDELARSDGPPTEVLVQGFDLKPVSADVILHVGGREYPAPIIVTDLVALPAVASGGALGLQELLLILSHRIGMERVTELSERSGGTTNDSHTLEFELGSRFDPDDVFRAWWSVAADLADPNLSIPAFRLRLEGGTGVGEAWARMRAGPQNAGAISASEAWFYGAELLRTLNDIHLPPGPELDAKAKLLDGFRERMRHDLTTLRFADDDQPWVASVRDFYGLSQV